MVDRLLTNVVELFALWFIVYGLHLIWDPLGYIGLGAGLLIISYGYTNNRN